LQTERRSRWPSLTATRWPWRWGSGSRSQSTMALTSRWVTDCPFRSAGAGVAGVKSTRAREMGDGGYGIKWAAPECGHGITWGGLEPPLCGHSHITPCCGLTDVALDEAVADDDGVCDAVLVSVLVGDCRGNSVECFGGDGSKRVRQEWGHGWCCCALPALQYRGNCEVLSAVSLGEYPAHAPP